MTLKSGIMAMGFGTALLLCGCVRSPRPLPPPPPMQPAHLHGSIHGTSYVSAEGGFSVPFPVSAEVRGRILRDGPQNVTFTDNWGSRISFAGQAILEHSPMLAMLEKDGREKALSEFARREYGNITTIHYHPELLEGAISFIYLRPASPKTGVAVFVHGRRVYIVETDALPGVELLAQNDEKSQLEREAWLEDRAVALAQSVEAR